MGILNSGKSRIINRLVGKKAVNVGNGDFIIEIIGRKRGCLEKRNMVDYEKVYKTVLNDMKNGLIRYCNI